MDSLKKEVFLFGQDLTENEYSFKKFQEFWNVDNVSPNVDLEGLSHLGELDHLGRSKYHSESFTVTSWILLYPEGPTFFVSFLIVPSTPDICLLFLWNKCF